MKTHIKFLTRCLTTIFMLIAVLSCDTASNVEDPDNFYYIKYFGGDGNQYAVDMVPLQDGSFFILGKYAETAFNADVYLLRVDAEGDLLWETRIGDAADDNDVWDAKDIEPTLDGNFVIVTDYVKNSGDSTDIKILKVSPEGTLLDSASFRTRANDVARSVTALPDGGFLVSGMTEYTATFKLSNETDPDLGDVLNFRLDANLDFPSTSDWTPQYHGFGSNLDVAVRTVTSPSGFYVFGYTNSTLSGDLNPNERLGLFYFERSVEGTLARVWYPGNIINVNDTEIQFVSPVAAALGGGFLVLGTSLNNVGVSEMFVARMRSSLSFTNPLQNDATFYNTIPLGRNIRGVSASTCVVGEQGFLLLGNEVRGIGTTNFWLTKIDQSGRVLWSTTFGSEAKDDMAAAVTELPDGKVVVLGTMGLADNQFKIAFIKLNRSGQLLK
jgi:hypothetical protein